MTAETLGVFMACGIFMMLLLLRLEAERFGAAEYVEVVQHRRGFWTWLSWFVVGAALLASLYFFHPAPRRVLYLLIGRRPEVVELGLALAALGVVQAAIFARAHYGFFRLPPAAAYPKAALNAVGTAVIDEATFRGALLGTLMALGFPDGASIVMAAIVYVLATRLAAPRRHPYATALAGGIGIVCGWATLATGGLGAAMIGHAVATFAVFVFTGHAGQVPLGAEPEEIARRSQTPAGWEDARRPRLAGRGAEPRGFAVREVSGYSDRTRRGRVDSDAAGGSSAGLGRLASWFRKPDPVSGDRNTRRGR